MKRNCTEEEKNELRHKIDTFRQKQKQPYEFKRAYAEARAWEFYNHPEIAGNTYVSIGGLDSITLFVFLHSIGIICPAVSVSYLEDTSIQRVHKALGVIPLKSAMRPDGTRWNMDKVVKELGYPVLSKRMALQIETLQRQTGKSVKTRHKIIAREFVSIHNISLKWLKLFGGADPEGAALGYAAAPFKVSSKCCYYMKEKPCRDYERESKRLPYLGLMASEGGERERVLKETGCNYVSPKTKRSCPFAIFNRDDVLRLAREMDAYYQEHWQEFNPDFKVDSIIPKTYGDIVETADGTLDTTGAKRTGCMICGFGVHLEKRPHRFDRIRKTNPRQWEYLMYNVGWGKVLDYIGVGWKDEVEDASNVSVFDILKEDENEID